MNRSALILFVSLVLSALAMAAIWMMDIPLGIEGEWVWERIAWDASSLWDSLLGGVLLVLVGGSYAAIVWKGANRIESATWISRGLWLMLLVAGGFIWLYAIQFCPPEGKGIEKYAHVIYYKGSSGYFSESRERKESLAAYLEHYEEDIQSEDVSRRVLHHGTHPPGLFIGFRGLIWLCDNSLELVEGVLKTQPQRVRAMFKEIDRPLAQGQALKDGDRAVIWLAALLVQFCGALAVVPLFFLSRQIASPRAAWIASAFWPLVPALSIFLPKSDVLMAFLGSVFLAVAYSGWRGKSLVRRFLAGVLLWFGMMFSLALLPVVFLFGVMMLWDILFSESDQRLAQRIKSSLPCLFAGLIGFLLSTSLVSWMARMNLFSVWWRNYQNHAEFYAHFPRSYEAWFVANPIEAFFAVGAPVCLCVVFAILRHWQDRNSVSRASWGPEAAFLLTMAVLWISGKNRGEAARLWLAVFPYFVWMTSRVWESQGSSETSARRSIVLPLLILQMLVCWLTVSRVYGFPLPL